MRSVVAHYNDTQVGISHVSANYQNEKMLCPATPALQKEMCLGQEETHSLYIDWEMLSY